MRKAMIAAVLAVGATVTGTTAAQAAPPPLNWQPCEENAAVSCSTITVPIDHAHPATGTIEVAVARKPATDPASRVGVLFYMPGGPGGSGVDALVNDTVPPEIQARFDVVTFDPRGTNRSHPVKCDAALLAEKPNVVPDAGGTLAGVEAYSRAVGDSCREHTGPLVDHIDNVAYAHDIDLIRAAIGERELTLYGVSYGTLTGQMYAENYPHRVRGMILDSVFDHSLSTSEFVLTEAETGEDAFAEFAKWCAADDTCALHGQDVGQVYGDLWAKSVRGELTFPGDPERQMDPLALAQGTNGFFYAPYWKEGAEFLRSLSTQQNSPAAAAVETMEFPIASFCNNNRVRFSSQRQWESLWHKQSEVAPTVRAHFGWLSVSLCSGWPAEVGNPQHPTDADDAPPILIMNSRHDPATGYAWAQSVNRQLDDSVLLTYDGWGHRAVDRSDCTIDAAMAYLVDRRLPRPGTHCAAVPYTPAPAEPSLMTRTGW